MKTWQTFLSLIANGASDVAGGASKLANGVVDLADGSGKLAEGSLRRKFRYDEERDCYICPCGQELQYRTTTREGYREYASKSEVCRECEVLKEYTRSSSCRKVLTRHVSSDMQN